MKWFEAATEELKQNYEDLKVAKGEQYAQMVILAAQQKAEIQVLRDNEASQEIINDAVNASAVVLFVASLTSFPDETLSRVLALQKTILKDSNSLIQSILDVASEK